MKTQRSRAEIKADIARFQKQSLRLIPKKKVKREMIQLLRSFPHKDLTPADIALELRTPLRAVIAALVELEAQQKIQPMTDTLISNGDDAPVKLNPPGKSKRNSSFQQPGDAQTLLARLEERCFAFEATRMYAYHTMLSTHFP